MKFVIIGGDAAGMSAASRAKRSRPDLDVTVLEKTMDVSYSACGMPYNLADRNREMDDLIVRDAKTFKEKQGIDLLTGHRADRLDPVNREVIGETSEGKEFVLKYDRLLIATGASAIISDLPGFDLPGVVALKSLEDGRKIKAFIKKNDVKKVAIIGMGYIALEMCEALCALGIEVEMVKPRPVFLPWMDEKMAAVVKEKLEANGVKIHPGHTIERIERNKDTFHPVWLKLVCTDLEIECGMILVSIGVKPNSNIVAGTNIKLSVGGSIAVDTRLRTSDKIIYAAGDCADAYHVVTGKKTWIPLALRANMAGRAVADNICDREVSLKGVVGTAVFKVFDLEVARTGLTMEESKKSGFDPVKIVIQTRSRAHAHPGGSDIWVQMIGCKHSKRLLGVQMIGTEGVAHRINAPAVALHNQMTVEEYSHSDLAYAPPFGPVWDPTLTAANQLIKELKE
ncbi:MAG: FAD-dependent oxidoreductase [Desulfobacterales bacterium]|nr:FAD-dependent oxidoreductase [Desulfobacterales bacterium]